MAEISSEQNAPAKEKKSAQRAAKSRACVKAVRCVSHQTDPVHKVVCRERQIERREGVCADSPCNEKNVGQNIAGKSDHAEDV